MPELITPCFHRSLTFAEGAFYIVCAECDMHWSQERGGLDPKFNNDLHYMRDIREEKQKENTQFVIECPRDSII